MNPKWTGMKEHDGCEFCGDCIQTFFHDGYGFICENCLREKEEEEYFEKYFVGPPIPWYWGIRREEEDMYKEGTFKDIPLEYFETFNFEWWENRFKSD